MNYMMLYILKVTSWFISVSEWVLECSDAKYTIFWIRKLFSDRNVPDYEYFVTLYRQFGNRTPLKVDQESAYISLKTEINVMSYFEVYCNSSVTDIIGKLNTFLHTLFFASQNNSCTFLIDIISFIGVNGWRMTFYEWVLNTPYEEELVLWTDQWKHD